MFELLTEHTGKIIINGKTYDSVHEAEKAFEGYKGGLDIILEPQSEVISDDNAQIDNTIYRVHVKRYMTNYDKSFFLSKMNKQGPMPYIIMYGRKIQSTEKLVQMQLWADLDSTVERTTTCMRCGRPLTNSYSQYLQLGPECGASEHIKLLESGMDLEEIKQSLKQKLNNVTWTGWIVKSAIISADEVEK